MTDRISYLLMAPYLARLRNLFAWRVNPRPVAGRRVSGTSAVPGRCGRSKPQRCEGGGADPVSRPQPQGLQDHSSGSQGVGKTARGEKLLLWGGVDGWTGRGAKYGRVCEVISYAPVALVVSVDDFLVF